MLSTLVAAMLVAVGPMGPDAPARAPQLAASGKTIALAFGAGKGIYFSSSQDAGKTFSPPVQVATGGIVPLSRHRGPRVVMTKDAIVISAVVGRKLSTGPHAHGLPADGDLMVWRSIDGGVKWSQAIVVNDVPGAATEGLHALAADDRGNLFAAWLDQRGAKGTSLYGARSLDGGLTWSKNVKVYESPAGTICQCCHPSVAIGAGGAIVVMWRNWLDGSRDMYLAQSPDGVAFSKPEKLGVGSWKLNACPMDGGGLVIAGKRVVTAWRRDGEVFLASPGEKEMKAGEGVDVALAAGSAGVYAIWTGPGGVQVLAPGKEHPAVVAAKGSFPSIVALPDGGALASWESEGKIAVQPVTQ